MNRRIRRTGATLLAVAALVVGGLMVSAAPAAAFEVQRSGDFNLAGPTLQPRLFRDAIPSSCVGAPKAFPGTSDGGALRYDAYQFFAAPGSCITVSFESSGVTHSVAYSAAPNAADPAAGYVGDSGVSSVGGATETYSFQVPVTGTFWVLFNTVEVQAPGAYTARVTLPDTGPVEPPPPPVTPDDDPCDTDDALPFTDVPATNVHAENIRCLAAIGLAQGGPGGLPADQYGPRQQTTRAQQASFVARMIEAGGVTLPAAPADAFSDDEASVHELRINQLAELGVIGGNGEAGGSFRPGDDITRGEMASFLHGAITELSGSELTSAEDAFTDDEGSPYEDAINALASVDIVAGTGGGLYDPDGTVQRDSMASFLAQTMQYLATQGHFPV